jgi:hypothetical protein
MNDQPLTRAELAEALDGQKRELLDAIRASKEEVLESVQEFVRDAQTEILKAFLPYQESQNARLHLMEVRLSNVDAGLGERMAILERRLAEIEKKLLLNPPPIQ